MIVRRDFIKKIIMVLFASVFPLRSAADNRPRRIDLKEARATVYRSVGGDPVENMRSVIHMVGGIEKFIGKDDVVIIKPNVQWWNQGTPNIGSVKTLVDLVMHHPDGFGGEVVIAENVHRGSQPWTSRASGWAHDYERNVGVNHIKNFNDLVGHLKSKYKEQFTAYHLINIQAGAKRVFTPEDGPGYVYCDGTGGVPLIQFDNGGKGEHYRSVVMTYPILRTDKGTIVDFKNGVWEKGVYSDQPVRFINFPALNHHSPYCGMSSAIKNYLGITDLSGGPDPHENGRLTHNHYNFHSFPFNKWTPGPVPGMIGAEIGIFINTIRKADLNIISAHWVGLASRTKAPVTKTSAILASSDPVALDYHAAKYLLYPNSKIPFHNPDDPNSPVYAYLKKCAEHNGGIFEEQYVAVQSYDFRKNRLQEDDELTVRGTLEWGRDIKTLMKYFAYRSGLYGPMIQGNG